MINHKPLSSVFRFFTKAQASQTSSFSVLKYVFASCVVFSSSTVWANVSNDDVIAKLYSAYGGSKLTSLNGITISDYRKNLFLEQSGPDQLPDLWRFNEELTIDFAKKRKALVSWRVNSTNKDLETFIVNETTGRVYDILHGRYVDDNWYNFKNTGAAVERMSDTLIAKKILSSKKEVKFLGEVEYKGSLHFLLSYSPSPKQESKVLINKVTGLISKASRNHPIAGELSYIFTNHAKVEQVAYARDMTFFVAKKPRTISTYRHIDISPNLIDKFAAPEDFTAWGEVLHSPDMQHKQLAKNVYHVGKGRSLNLFIDAGDYFISAGGDGSIKDNFLSLQQYLNVTKPLKYSLLTHHHRRQLNMIEPALALGAKIVTVENNLSAINKKLGYQLALNNVVLVDKTLSLMDGKVSIYDIATAHADQNLVVYLNQNNMLFAEDHYEILYKKGNPRAFQNMVTFANKIKALPVEVDTFINGSSTRLLSIEEFESTVKGYVKPICPQRYRVCQAG